MIATLHTQWPNITSSHAQDTRPYQAKSDWSSTPKVSAYAPCSVPVRAQMNPPRALEPGASHERTRSMQENRPHDYFHPAPQRTTTLPGVRDILSPPSSEPTYHHHDAWRAAAPQHTHHFQEHPYHPHPPVSYQLRPAHDRRLELPILETRHQPGLAPSPFGPPQLEQRDHDPRPRQMSGSSYARDSVLSLYTPSYEDIASRAAYERNGVSFTPSSIDASKRYVIEDTPEGQFYVFENGLKIPLEVDGERVNPQWGLTKANKPRKRLALACMDCREKKIKCEPGASTSCLQCEKAKRVCRKSTSNHNQHDAGSTTEWSSNAGSPPSARPGANAAEPIPPANRDADMDMLQKRRAQDELAVNIIKRQKSTSPASVNNLFHPGVNGAAAPRLFSEDGDAFAIDPGLTLHLLDLYFTNVNSGVYSLFPREPFMRWVSSCTNKSQTDRVVLYAMMAVASVFNSQQYGAPGEHCAALAVTALNAKFGKFSLGLVHIRLLLALYHFARGSKGIAWEHCGAAMRTISALHFNNEEGCSNGPDTNPTGTNEYGLTYNQAVECRRRTFWCGFMMDRFSGFCEGMLCTVDKADVYLRLPCTESVFQAGTRSQAPFFDNGIVDRADAVLTSSAPVASMAHLAMITSIWGDVMNFVYRGVHRSSSGHAAAYETFYTDTYKALQTWSSRLPDHLAYSPQNLVNSVREGHAGDFVAMHILYRYALLKLNRCMRWSLMSANVARNICEAHTHAHQLLQLVSRLNATKHDEGVTPAAYARCFSFSTPFIGFAILSAIDVISAGGPDDNLKPTMSAMREGLAFLRELAQYWSSAMDQAKAGEKRFLQLNNVVVRPYKAASGCWLGRKWGLIDPLERELDLKDDCIYGVEHVLYFEALEQLEQLDSSFTKGGA